MRSKRRVHLVYPSGAGIGCPQAIGRHLAQHLAQRFDVQVHAWDEPQAIQAQPGDLLLGHPHPSPWTVFRLSLGQSAWSKVVMLCPYNADERQVDWLDPVVEKVDRYLAITGPYWAKRLPRSPQARWAPKFQALDLAVDRQDYPRLKKGFARPGQRRFLYIGHAGWPKNTALLSRLALARRDWDFAWIGGSDASAIPGVKALGRLDLSLPASKQLVRGFDFLITLGTADANPSTILEAMAWGLVPVCSPQSGYEGLEGIPNVPIDDFEAALAALDGLQAAPESVLKGWVRQNDRRLKEQFHWERFCAQVEKALLTLAGPALAPHTLGSWARLRSHAWRGPNAPWRPRWALKALRDRWRQG